MPLNKETLSKLSMFVRTCPSIFVCSYIYLSIYLSIYPFICMYVCIYLSIFIIIMSRRLRGYPWPSLAISPYHSSPPAGLQGYIPCPHIAAVCKFVLVVPLLHIHVWGSTGVHRLWARPACLVRRTCIVFVMGGKCPYSWSLVGCCRQDLFNTALNILL